MGWPREEGLTKPPNLLTINVVVVQRAGENPRTRFLLACGQALAKMGNAHLRFAVNYRIEMRLY